MLFRSEINGDIDTPLFSSRPGAGRREATKKPSEYGGPYPLSSSDLVVSSGHLWVKVAGQGRWPEGLAYRSGRIFDWTPTIAYGRGQMQLLNQGS